MKELMELPPRELDARLAECMEPKPIRTIWARQRSERGFWESWNREWYPAEFSSPSAPRSLIESVEAEIERRGLIREYCEAIEELTEDDQHIPVEMRSWWAVASAKANVKAAAAVAVMEPK